MFTFQLIETTNPITNTVSTTVVRSDGALIPVDPANSDYQRYLRYTAWVEAGNDPDEFWVAGIEGIN